MYEMMSTKHLSNSYRKKNGAINGHKVMLNWTPEAEASFDKLKKLLSSDTVLIMPNFNEKFILVTDSCDYAYGVIFSQRRNEQEMPIAYFSKSMTQAQRNYSTSEKELLAVVMAIEHFHQFLYGREFVISDHLPLSWILKKKTLTHGLQDGSFV